VAVSQKLDPKNLERMKTGEVAQIAREHGIPDVEKMNKQQLIEALTRQAGGQGGQQRTLPPNLEQMKTGEVAQIAREFGIPDVEKMNKQQMIEALTRQAGVQSGGQVAGQASGQGKDPRPPGTKPEEWKDVPGNQS
jgi:transcription termination factor Rho